MRLVALLTLRELAQSGYYMALLDLPVMSTLLRFVQGAENSKSSLYQATLEVI